MKRSKQDTTFLPEPDGPLEMSLVRQGFTVICGCDEAGRGPLAGPVVGAAVIFRDCEVLWSCRDSKAISAERREALFPTICEQLEYSFTIVDADQIDHVNIRVASLQAMSESVRKLSSRPDIIYVDGRDKLPDWSVSYALIKGDARVATISAASIVAKVVRDRLMRDYHTEYPDYGFDKHFGYPTEIHREALKKFGPCPIHRRTYRGVRELVG